MPTSIRPIIHHQENKRGSPFYTLDDSDVSDDESTSSYERLPPLTHVEKHHDDDDDLPPVIAPSDSVETYDSMNSSTKVGGEDLVEGDELVDGEFATKDGTDYSDDDHMTLPEDGLIPTHLPYYDPIPFHDHPVHPTTPKLFSTLFPTMDRLSILHDDFTADGNMNLRIETPVILPKSRHERAAAFQLFHLRMHDLPRREFSLRRYCRDSGREVCCTKRLFAVEKDEEEEDSDDDDDDDEDEDEDGAGEKVKEPRPGVLRRSTTRMLHSMKTPFQRSSNASSVKRPASRRSQSSTTTNSTYSSWHRSPKEKDTSAIFSTSAPSKTFHPITPTDTIKLEFSNYARVDVTRNARPSSSSSRATRTHTSSEVSYDFEWWGHSYSWKRCEDRYTGAVTYHLIRDGQGKGVAHMVPKTRGMEEERVDGEVGGWVKPMRMWVSDGSVFGGLTDVADVIMATGLIALVDDSIRTRWPLHHHYNQHRPGPPMKSYTEGEMRSKERAMLPRIFHRRRSEQMGGSIGLGKGRRESAN